MKKILLTGLIVLIVFLIYLCNIDKKVYYLALGDSLATGEGAYGKKIKGYTTSVKDYLKQNDLLEIYVNEFAENGYRTTDLINAIKDNKKIKKQDKEITIQNSLIKADLVTLSIGANDILNKINIEQSIDYKQIYNYIDDLSTDLDKLLKLMREYCKEDIVLIGYYNPYPYLNNKEIDDIFYYLNKKYKEICEEYNVNYVEIDQIFKENPDFLPNDNDIHPSNEGYKTIADHIIITLNKTLLKSWLLSKDSATIYEQSNFYGKKFVMAEGEIEWKRTFIQIIWKQK